MSEVMKAVEVPVFVKKRHELATLLKQLEFGSQDAVELLIATVGNVEAGLKMQVECAKVLIDMQVKVSAEISRDQLVRQIAEIKAKGLSTPLELEGGGKRLPPKLDLTTIQKVG